MILGYRREKAEPVSAEMELELKRGLGISVKIWKMPEDIGGVTEIKWKSLETER